VLHCTGLMLGLYRYKKSISFLEVLKLVRITDAKVHRITFTIMSARLTRYTVAADQSDRIEARAQPESPKSDRNFAYEQVPK